MSQVSPLIAYALRQVIGDSADTVVGAVERYFTDRGRALPQALHKADESAWQALAIALAGDTKGIRDEIRRFLNGKPFSFEGTPDEFRKVCLVELKQARKDGLLSAEQADARAVRLAAPVPAWYSEQRTDSQERISGQ
jgi:hypothetical protein